MAAQSHTSRRLFLAAGPATAVFGALAQAAATCETDPIFAAIKRHKVAKARYCAACGQTDEVAAELERRPISDADIVEFDAADRESNDALDALLATTPATMAGVRALLRHCIDQKSVEQFLGEALETLLQSPALQL